MAKYRRKNSRKNNWKGLLSVGLAILLCVGAIAGIASLTGKETTTISALSFKVGAIGENGNYISSDTSIYTKDMFECQGLTIEPDFEATGTFRVFYYGEDKAFLAATDVMDASEGAYVKGDEHPEAKYARVVITPEVPTDDDGAAVEDFKISSYQVAGYANDYTITVAKDQTSDVPEEPTRAPLNEVVTGPMDDLVIEPTDDLVTEPMDEIITEPMDEIITEPMDEIITEPMDEVVTEPALEPVA